MSEQATRVSVDAQAFMDMQHELRQYREAEQFPDVVPSFSLRKGVITARDPATYTVTVLFSAADTSDFPGVPIPGIRLASTVYPKVGAVCFVAFNGPDPTVLFTVNSPVGRARVRRATGTGSIASGVTSPLSFTTPADFDTDGLFNPGVANDRLTCQWPGIYDLKGTVTHDAAAAGRRIADIRVNGSIYVGRLDLTPSGGWGTTVGQILPCSTDYELVVGDYVELCGYQSSGGPSGVSAVSELGPCLTMTWTDPPAA